MGAHINPINQNSKRLSIPDLILVDVFTAIYFVLVTIANSAWPLRDHMIVYPISILVARNTSPRQNASSFCHGEFRRL